MKYDYFYEEQSEQFVFYIGSQGAMQDDEFRSFRRMLLYGLLLDRVSLSKRTDG